MAGYQRGDCIGVIVVQLADGGCATTVTVWLHEFVLPRGSVASHVRVMICRQPTLVTVVWMVMGKATPVQASDAKGGSKFQPEPQLTVLSLTQDRTGGAGSCVQVMTWVQVLE